MRFRSSSYSFLGLTFVAFVVAGCAAGRHSQDTDGWSVTAGVTNQQFSLSTDEIQKAPPQRLSLNRPAEFDFAHPRIDAFVTKYQTNLRGFYSRALARSGRYVPRMTSILEKEGVPAELAYLPLIESGFSTRATSRAGAAGPWQFIPGTGRRYGLRIDQYVDERRDPVKSTRAAARYLKDLHEMFGDWHLSLAAYNTGEGNIMKALGRVGADGFWDMRERGYLYQETEDYVPGFLAALQIAEDPEAYGFDTPEEQPVKYDLVRVDRSIRLSTVAKLSGASVDEIQDLNPALHRGIVPPKGYTVRIPKGTKDDFQIALASYSEPAPVVRSKHRKKVARSKGHPAKGVTKKRPTHGRLTTVAAASTHHRPATTRQLAANNSSKSRNSRHRS